MPPERRAPFCPQCGSPTALEDRFGRLRPVCGACGHVVFFDPKVAVVACVIHEGKLLMIQRANDPGKGRWALPAGFMDLDEDPQAAVERETLEEAGVCIEVERVVTLLHRPDADGLADLVIVYAARWVAGEAAAADDAEAVGWFGKDDLPEIALESTRLLVAWWQAGKL